MIRLKYCAIVHRPFESLALRRVTAAALVILGGADAGSRLVVGPETARTTPVVPLHHLLENVHEVAGVGTLFPDEEGNPGLHMHTACGRQGETVTGCVRTGVRVWHVMEAVLFELTDTPAAVRLGHGNKLPQPL